jgi:hypothetical protein
VALGAAVSASVADAAIESPSAAPSMTANYGYDGVTTGAPSDPTATGRPVASGSGRSESGSPAVGAIHTATTAPLSVVAGNNGVAMPAPQGTRIEMAMSPGQTRPGGFGTLDHIPDVDFARNNLAIRPDWKAEISYVQAFEVPPGVQIQVGPVGPQTLNGVTYPGGATQVEILNYSDRARLVPVGDPRPIK